MLSLIVDRLTESQETQLESVVQEKLLRHIHSRDLGDCEAAGIKNCVTEDQLLVAIWNILKRPLASFGLHSLTLDRDQRTSITLRLNPP